MYCFHDSSNIIIVAYIFLGCSERASCRWFDWSSSTNTERGADCVYDISKLEWNTLLIAIEQCTVLYTCMQRYMYIVCVYKRFFETQGRNTECNDKVYLSTTWRCVKLQYMADTTTPKLHPPPFSEDSREISYMYATMLGLPPAREGESWPDGVVTGEARGLLPLPPIPVGGIRLVLIGGSILGIDRGVPGSWRPKWYMLLR